MKKTLLLITLSFSGLLSAQILQNESFNSLSVGNIGTDITGMTGGQGSWLTFSSNGTAPTTSTNAAASNFQIVASGNSTTNGLQLIGPDGNKGSRYMWLDGFATAWGARTAGNNNVEVEYDFYTGGTTTSTTAVGMQLYDSNYNILSGFVYAMDTRSLKGIAYLNNGGTPDHFTINLGASNTDLILNPNTWYRVGFGYDSTTGQPYWKVGSDATVTINNAYWEAPTNIIEIDFAQEAPSTNTVSSTIIFDNFVARATNTDTLLGTDDFKTVSNTFSIYPIPVDNILNVNSDIVEIKSLSILDLNGRMIKKIDVNNTISNLDVSDLNSGVYM
ncbi:T9SS type A sorting domain-containing protein, partial [Flavobacterium sp. 9AF]|uniref:T9SS type A sorting domain-containing protein n=1 Tax=Flavobacterium sp. 9AF TaxID=2653142 RepID=UPI0013596673